MSPLLAPSGGRLGSALRPLSEVLRTYRDEIELRLIRAFDPSATLAVHCGNGFQPPVELPVFSGYNAVS